MIVCGSNISQTEETITRRITLVLVMAALATTASTGNVQAQQEVRRSSKSDGGSLRRTHTCGHSHSSV